LHSALIVEGDMPRERERERERERGFIRYLRNTADGGPFTTHI